MVTLKQVEAFYHVVTAGSFNRAAEQLNTTQSTISKRVQQLEAWAASPLFDRSSRGQAGTQTLPLTPRGEQFFQVAYELLRVRAVADAALGAQRVPRKLHLGVTHLTAFTWLAPFVGAIQTLDEMLEIIVRVETSPALFERFSKHALDYIVVPSLFRSYQYQAVDVGEVVFNWSASEFLNVPNDMSLEGLSRFTVLTHDESSGAGLMFSRWLAERSVILRKKRETSNLATLVGLTVSGIGISYLPTCFEGLLVGKKVKILKSLPALPTVPYMIMHRGENGSVDDLITECASRSCNFSQAFQALDVYRQKPGESVKDIPEGSSTRNREQTT